MNKQNRGKDFEAEIKRCLEEVSNVSVDRLPDAMGGYSGVKNVCDYMAYHYPHNFYIECKCLYGNTLNYKSAISKNQWEGLEEKSKIKGCVATTNNNCVFNLICFETNHFEKCLG